MAGFQRRGGSFRVRFRFRGKQYMLPVGMGIVEVLHRDGTPLELSVRDGRSIPPTTLESLAKRSVETHRELLETNTVKLRATHFRRLK